MDRLNSIFEELATSLEDKQKKIKISPKAKSSKSVVQVLNKFEEEMAANSKVYQSIARKAEKYSIPVEILGEVYDRGTAAWTVECSQDKQQFAFSRINSYINQGRSYFEEDADLHDGIEAHTAPKSLKDIIGETFTEFVAGSLSEAKIGGTRTVNVGAVFEKPGPTKGIFKHITFSFEHPYKAGVTQPDGAFGHYLSPKFIHHTLHSHPQVQELTKAGWRHAPTGTTFSLNKLDVKRGFKAHKHGHEEEFVTSRKYKLEEEVQLNELKIDPNDPKNREQGTDSLVQIYKDATPGQEKMEEEVRVADRIAITLPGYRDRHGNFIPTMTTYRKRNKKIIKSGSNTDGKPLKPTDPLTDDDEDEDLNK